MTLYAPPAIPVFAAGYDPVTADYNAEIQAPLGFCTQGILFRAERHASQSLSSGNTVIGFDTVLEDPFSGWNSGTGEWTAPYTGWYEVTVTIITAAGIATTVGAGITTPETSYRLGNATAAATSLPGGASGAQIVPLIGGTDWVAGFAYSSSSGLTTSTADGQYSTMEISWVSA